MRGGKAVVEGGGIGERREVGKGAGLRGVEGGGRGERGVEEEVSRKEVKDSGEKGAIEKEGEEGIKECSE